MNETQTDPVGEQIASLLHYFIVTDRLELTVNPVEVQTTWQGDVEITVSGCERDTGRDVSIRVAVDPDGKRSPVNQVRVWSERGQAIWTPCVDSEIDRTIEMGLRQEVR